MSRILRLVPKREVLFEKFSISQADYFACEIFLFKKFDRAVFIKNQYESFNIFLYDKYKSHVLIEIEMDEEMNKVFLKTSRIYIKDEKDIRINTIWFSNKKIMKKLDELLEINEDDVGAHIDERLINVLITFIKKYKIVNDEVISGYSINHFRFEDYDKYGSKNISEIK